MKRKMISIVLALCLTMSLTACGSSGTSTESKNPSEAADTSDDTDEALDAEENLSLVEFNVPAEFVGDSTQEELDATANENGFDSITLNEDGSATYVMTKAKHQEMMVEITDTINAALEDMIGSEDYPNITDITANDDFTEFTVTTSSTELSFSESLLVIAFYTYGGTYNIFNTTPVDNIHVDFVNSESGEIIDTVNSSD